jgi:glycosyltransferase involved in cell wall biosynthesis
MRVIVAAGGKWSSFEQAAELHQRGHLAKLLTTYHSRKRGFLPRFRDDREPIPLDKVFTNILPEALKRIGRRVPLLRNQDLPMVLAAEVFDSWACRQMEPCDVYLVWASFGLRSMVAAKAVGAATVLCRSNVHVSTETQVVQDEFERAGVPGRFLDVHPKLADRNLREYEEADYILTPTNYVSDSFLAHGVPASKLIMVHNKVDLSPFYPVPKEDDVFRFIYVGRLEIWKGVHHLLEAFSTLGLPNSELVLVGPVFDEMKPFLRRYEGTYRLTGFIPRVELYHSYSQGSVAVLPSIHEALGGTVLEAMACGIPVICTNTGAAEVVRDGVDGFVVNTGDVEALRQRMLYLYEHREEAREMGRRALKRVEEFCAGYGDNLERALLDVADHNRG